MDCPATYLGLGSLQTESFRFGEIMGGRALMKIAQKIGIQPCI